MAKESPNRSHALQSSHRMPDTPLNLAAGVSLGLLLGLLIGLSASPVVSIVITALVALLAGFFGLSPNAKLRPNVISAQRLTAFALSAAVATPMAIWVRTHDVLAPSTEEHKQKLREIGYLDGQPAQREMLRYLRYGLLPAGAAASNDRTRATVTVLYADLSATFCDALARTTTADDLLVLLKAEPSLQTIASTIDAMPQDKKNAAPEWVKLFLCKEP
jgi:hypothetical protein